MSGLSESGIFQRFECVQNRAYVLNDNNDFFQTGYRFLNDQKNDCFLRCSKLLYNGRIKLIYFSLSFEPLSDIVSGISADDFISILAGLLSSVIEVQNNGFLYCPNIDLSADTIFADRNTMEVKLVYIPVSNHCSGITVQEFMTELRAVIIRLIRLNPHFASDERIMDINQKLFSGTLAVSDLYSHICSMIRHSTPDKKNVNDFVAENESESYLAVQEWLESSEPVKEEVPDIRETPEMISDFTDVSKAVPEEQSQPSYDSSGSEKTSVLRKSGQPVLRLTTVSTAIQHEYCVTVPKFSLGKNSENGRIDFSRTVSREHCEIHYIEGAYYVIDKGSKNGTFIKRNGDLGYLPRLSAESKEQIFNGDYLKLADVEFLVTI